MPGVLKIGRSNNGGKYRAVQLFSTGVPTPFKLEFEILVGDAAYVEKAAHDSLANSRINDGREFFKCELHEAIEAITREFLCMHDLDVCNPDERDAIDNIYTLSMKTDHHPMVVLSSMKFLDINDIDRAVGKQTVKLRVVK